MEKFLVSIVLLVSSLCHALTWYDLSSKPQIFLYAGDISQSHMAYSHYTGLSLTKSDKRHINHDITKPMLLPDNCVDRYQAEDVFEHIEYEKLPWVINEIYRVLKPGGLFRLSVPDYRCDIVWNRSWKDKTGTIYFDPGGGGTYHNGRVIGGGHLWFPTIELLRKLLENTVFFTHGKIDYLHYYEVNGISVTTPIDYSLGYIQRTPDHDKRVKHPFRCLSIVVDLYKSI